MTSDGQWAMGCSGGWMMDHKVWGMVDGGRWVIG